MKEDIVVPTGISKALIQKTGIAQTVKLANQNLDYAVIRNIAAAADEDFFVEDEDENTLFAKKYVLQTSYFLIFAFAFVACFLYSCFKYRLPLCVHLSHLSSSKYLIQRDLRI